MGNSEWSPTGGNGGSLSLTAVFDIRAYGAKLDGVTDDRAALDAVIAAATTYISGTGLPAAVYIGPGTLYLNSQCAAPPTNPSTGLPYSTAIGTGLPVNLSAKLKIVGAGRGVTTIKLSPNVQNVFWINQQADYDVFKLVEISDITVDNNNTTGRCHILIGSMPAALTSQRRLNYENLTIRRIDILNVPIDETQTATLKSGILLLGDHVSALEATQTHTTDVTVEDIRQYGGAGAAQVTCWHAGSFVGGTNHYYNNIFIRRIIHDNSGHGVCATNQNHTSVHICGTGFGDYFEIDSVISIDSGDDAIEVGAMQSGTIDNVYIVNPWLEGILFRNSHALADVASQRITLGSVKVVVDSNGAAISGFEGRPIAWAEDTSSSGFGQFDIGSFEWSGDSLLYSKQDQNDIAFLFTTAVQKIVFDRLKVRLSNYGADSGSGTVDATLINYNTGSGMLIINDLDIVAEVTASAGSGLTYFFAAMKHTGNHNVCHVGGYRFDFSGSSWTNSTGGGSYGYLVAKNGGSNIQGTLRRFYPLGTLPTGAGLRAVSVQNAATITSFMIQDCDFSVLSGLGAGKDLDLASAGANGAKVYIRNVIGYDGIWLGPGGRRGLNGSYTMLAGDARTMAFTTTSSAFTLTLPAANSVPVGELIVVQDESNHAATDNITVSRAGSDIFTDAATTKAISTNNGSLKLYSTGSQWQVVT